MMDQKISKKHDKNLLGIGGQRVSKKNWVYSAATDANSLQAVFLVPFFADQLYSITVTSLAEFHIGATCHDYIDLEWSYANHHRKAT